MRFIPTAALALMLPIAAFAQGHPAAPSAAPAITLALDDLRAVVSGEILRAKGQELIQQADAMERAATSKITAQIAEFDRVQAAKKAAADAAAAKMAADAAAVMKPAPGAPKPAPAKGDPDAPKPAHAEPSAGATKPHDDGK